MRNISATDNTTGNMIIGFDGKRAVLNFTGLGNYSRFIISALNRNYPDNTYKVFSPEAKGSGELESMLQANTSVHLPQRFIDKKLPSLWRTKRIVADLKNEGVGLYHGLSNEIPVGIEESGIKSVVTIHDLIFLRYPEYYKPVDRKIYDRKFRSASERSDRIIAVSECTKRDIISFYGIPAGKIDVVYQGFHPIFSAAPGEVEQLEIKKLYSLPERFVLCVGTVEERKNLILLAKALRRLPEDIHLVAAGKRTPYAEKVEKYCAEKGLSKRLHIIEGVPFRLLPALYSLASAFAYPSRFEGFGIPIIEALQTGIPVLAATGSCLEEAGGNGALYVNPDDAEAAADALQRLLYDAGLTARLKAAGKEQIRKFSPENIANGVNGVYRKVTGKSL